MSWSDQRFVDAFDEPGALERRVQQSRAERVAVLLSGLAMLVALCFLPAELPSYVVPLLTLGWILALENRTAQVRVLMLMQRVREATD